MKLFSMKLYFWVSTVCLLFFCNCAGSSRLIQPQDRSEIIERARELSKFMDSLTVSEEVANSTWLEKSSKRLCQSLNEIPYLRLYQVFEKMENANDLTNFETDTVSMESGYFHYSRMIESKMNFHSGASLPQNYKNALNSSVSNECNPKLDSLYFIARKEGEIARSGFPTD